MEKIINQPQRARLFLLAVAATAAVGVSSLLSTIPVQNANAQTIGEFILLNPDCERKNNKIECPGGIEAKLDNNGEFKKIELPGCKIKEHKNECTP